jgi:hypothetical protein
MARCWLSLSRVRDAAVAVVIFALLLSSCSTKSTSTGSRPTQPASGGQLTPLLDSTLSAPQWFSGTDGKARLVYELLLTNAIQAPVTLSALEVPRGRFWRNAHPIGRRLAACGHVARHNAGHAHCCSTTGIGRHRLA